MQGLFFKETACVRSFRKREKKSKRGQNIWRFGQKCTKFEYILKKGSLMRATITCMKQLTYALTWKWPGCNRWGNGYNFNPLMHNVRWPDTLWKFAANAARCLQKAWSFWDIMHYRVETTAIPAFCR